MEELGIKRDEKGRFIKGFKHSLEELHLMGFPKKGIKRPPFSDEWKRKIGEAGKGRVSSRKGKKLLPLTEECKSRISEALRGEKAYNFKGGRRSLVKRVRETYKYKQWRSDIFKRDNWTCQTCSKRGVFLEAHHIKQFAYILDEYKILNVEQALALNNLWDINNGVTLCSPCHNLTKHGRNRKRG